jgi:hypothetical protein
MCANNIPRPKSAVDSQGPRQLLTTVVLPLVLVPAKIFNILLMQLLEEDMRGNRIVIQIYEGRNPRCHVN